MRPQRPCRFRAGWPPLETSLGQALGGQPEPLAIVRQYFDGRTPAATKDEHTTGKRVGIQLLPAKLGEAIYALPCVNGFDCNEDAELRSDLYQETASHKARLSVAKSAAGVPLQWIRSLP